MKGALIWLLIFSFISDLTTCDVYHITPSSSDPCPEELHCLTLSQFTANASNYLQSNTIVIVSHGNHTLYHTVTIENIESFRMLTLVDSGSFVYIKCSTAAAFKFKRIRRLYISGMQLIECGGNRIELVNNFTLENSKLYGNGANLTALEIVQATGRIVSTSFVAYSNNIRSRRQSSRYKRCRVGGAVIASHTKLTISNSKFERNIAERGGAIYGERGSIITITNSTFVENCATGYSGPRTCHSFGGAVYIFNSTINKMFNRFEHNNAVGNGGVLTADVGSTVNSSNNHYSVNSAGREGGVMCIYRNSMVSSKNDHFSNNNVGELGGVMVARSYSKISISNGQFNSNSAGERGGVLWARISTINSSNSHFSSNSARLEGGVVLAKICNVSNDHDEFQNNKAGTVGGVIRARFSTISCKNSYFNNSASNAMVIDYSTLNSSNVHFSNNRADNDGGVLQSYGSTINSNGSYFIGNSAGGDGGVLHGQNTIVASTNDHFTNNSAGNNGGIISLILNSTISSNNDHFTNNRAGLDGGVVLLLWNSTISSKNNHFMNNSAGGRGGVLYQHWGSEIYSSNDNFINNRAGRSGGVVYSLNGYVRIVRVNAVSNDAGSDGGVFKLIQGKFEIAAGNVSRNSAKRGGVVRASQLELAIILNTVFSVNTAETGGVLSIHGRYIHVEGISLLYNSATTAVVYLIDSTAMLTGNITLSDNMGSLVAIVSNVTMSQFMTFTSGRVF